jgi:AcrR family transcriptional regulator
MTSSAAQKRPTPRKPRGRPASTPEPDRFLRIAEAAIACFSELGYRRTQVADIARQMGVAAGTLYLSVDSKEALLHLAVMRLCGEGFEGLAVPFPAPPVSQTVLLLRKAVAERTRFPALDLLLERRKLPVFEDLLRLGEEIYDRLASEARAIWLIDRCSLDIPELGNLHRDELRGAVLASLIRLMERHGKLDHGKAAILARNALEMLTWAAVHRRRNDRFHADGIMPADEAAIRAVSARCFAVMLENAEKETA